MHSKSVLTWKNARNLQNECVCYHFCKYSVLNHCVQVLHVRGVVLKSGGTPETRLKTKILKQFKPTHTYTHTRQKN